MVTLQPKLQLIAVKMEGKSVESFKLADITRPARLDNGLVDKTTPFRTDWFDPAAVADMVLNNKAIIVGIHSNGLFLEGSNGSFNRYANLKVVEPNKKYPLTVFERVNINGVDGCTVIDVDGRILTVSMDKLVKYAEAVGISNGKVVEHNGNKFISSIRGEYERLGVKPTYEQVVHKTEEAKDIQLVHKLKRGGENQPGYWPEGAKLRDDKLNLTAEEKLVVCFKAIQNWNFFIYSILSQLVLIPVSPNMMAMPTMGVDIRMTLIYNPYFVLDLPLEQLVLILLHETYHILFSHPARIAEMKLAAKNNGTKTGLPRAEEAKLYNIAADLFVNKYIADQFNKTLERLIKFPHTVSKTDPFVTNNQAKAWSRGIKEVQLPDGLCVNDMVDCEKDTIETLFKDLIEQQRRQFEQENKSQNQNQSEEQDKNESDSSENNKTNSQTDDNSQNDSNNFESDNNGEDDNSKDSDDTQINNNEQSGTEENNQMDNDEQTSAEDTTTNQDNDSKDESSSDEESLNDTDNESDSDDFSDELQKNGSSTGQGKGNNYNGTSNDNFDDDSDSDDNDSDDDGNDEDLSEYDSDYEDYNPNSKYDANRDDLVDNSDITQSKNLSGKLADNAEGYNNDTESDESSEYDADNYRDAYESLKARSMSERREEIARDLDTYRQQLEAQGSDLVDGQDDSDSEDMTPEEYQQQVEDLKNWKEKLKSTVLKAEVATQSRGLSLSAAERRLVDSIIKPIPINWKVLLKRMFNMASQKANSYKRPSRRPEVDKNVILPGKARKDPEGLQKIIFAIDTSGSVGDKELQYVLGTIRALTDKYKVDVEIMWWSTRVNGVVPIKSTKDLVKAYRNVASDGGTDAENMFKYIADKRGPYRGKQVHGLIVFTDGYVGTVPTEYKRVAKHILWMIHSRAQGSFNAPFGTTAYVEVDD